MLNDYLSIRGKNADEENANTVYAALKEFGAPLDQKILHQMTLPKKATSIRWEERRFAWIL
jgi:hypothetical protein